MLKLENVFARRSLGELVDRRIIENMQLRVEEVISIMMTSDVRNDRNEYHLNLLSRFRYLTTMNRSILNHTI